MSEVYSWRDAPLAQFAVLGDPIGHTWSPTMHNAALRHLGRDEKYVAIHVPLDDFEEALDHLENMGYVGVNCTVPLKEAAYEWARCYDPESLEYQSLNTLRLADRSGTNTDAPGFLDTLLELGIDPPGPVLLMGAGGTARALAGALVRTGYRLRIFNRTEERAIELARELGPGVEVVDHPRVGDHQLLVNATSAGLSGSPIDIAWGPPNPAAVAYDVMYGAVVTPFLLDAQNAGLRTIDGKGMLAAQGARSLSWWLGIDVPKDVMLAALP